METLDKPACYHFSKTSVFQRTAYLSCMMVVSNSGLQENNVLPLSLITSIIVHLLFLDLFIEQLCIQGSLSEPGQKGHDIKH